MGDWKPEKVVKVNSNGTERLVYFWTMPEKGANNKKQDHSGQNN
jgi:hypothetical protein